MNCCCCLPMDTWDFVYPALYLLILFALPILFADSVSSSSSFPALVTFACAIVAGKDNMTVFVAAYTATFELFAFALVFLFLQTLFSFFRSVPASKHLKLRGHLLIE
ncbi:hypothetical protein BpHYR1_003452 [Brachionus plicatilis]|uniref:Uncharacterized protein n=1 Tax=Brachionus plicatilis TaxID=10195 RepID=A0A3M7TBD8_BRAPC|nr:hypothetical protein BpHYR1_003452 [Brachionus plicatilis]